MGLSAGGRADGSLFPRDCRSRKAHAPLRKSLRLHTCSGWPISEIVTGLWRCVQNFPAYFESSARLWLFSYARGEWRYSCSAIVLRRAPAPAGPRAGSRLGGKPRRPPRARQWRSPNTRFRERPHARLPSPRRRPQGANPVLRIAIKHHVPDVEPGLNPRALEFSNVLGHLHGAQQKFVPDFFDGDHNFQLLSEWKKLADLFLGTAPGVTIGSLRIDNSRDKQHHIGT